MKHFLAAALCSTTMLAASQCTKYAVVENFTNVGCGPCYSAHLIFDDMMATYPNEIFGIGYHINYPDDGDPMYVHAADQMEYIQEYYDVFGVPHIKVGGVWAGGIDESIVDAELDDSAPIGIEVTAEVSGDQLNLTADILSCSNVPDGNYSIKFIVVETLYINSPPQNWALDFTLWHNIFRRTIPEVEGDNFVPASEGNSVEHQHVTDIHPDWIPENLKVIVVVQNEDTHDVVNAGISQNIVTDIPSLVQEDQIEMYPNPADEVIVIKGPFVETAIFQIIDPSGKLVFAERVQNGSNTIDTSSLNPGLYICHFTNSSGIYATRKLAIK